VIVTFQLTPRIMAAEGVPMDPHVLPDKGRSGCFGFISIYDTRFDFEAHTILLPLSHSAMLKPPGTTQ